MSGSTATVDKDMQIELQPLKPQTGNAADGQTPSEGQMSNPSASTRFVNKDAQIKILIE